AIPRWKFRPARPGRFRPERRGRAARSIRCVISSEGHHRGSNRLKEILSNSGERTKRGLRRSGRLTGWRGVPPGGLIQQAECGAERIFDHGAFSDQYVEGRLDNTAPLLSAGFHRRDSVVNEVMNLHL